MTNDDRRFLRFAVLVCILALFAGVALGAFAVQMQNVGVQRDAIRGNFEATMTAIYQEEISNE